MRIKNISIQMVVCISLITSFDATGQELPISDAIKLLDSSVPIERNLAIESLRNKTYSELQVIRTLEGQFLLSHQGNRLQKALLAERIFSKNTLPLINTDHFQYLKQSKDNDRIYFNRKTKTIMVPAVFKLEHGVLEYVVVSDGPSAPVHETVLSVMAKASAVCLAMLSCGYDAADDALPVGGGIMHSNTGVNISIQFEFEKPHAGMVDNDPAQRVVATPENPKYLSTIRVPIECFIFNSATQLNMRRAPFLFTGSYFLNSAKREAPTLAADADGPLVALKQNPAALMNTVLNTREIDPQKRAGYVIDRYTIPSRGRKCFVVLEATSERTFSSEELNDTRK